MIASLGYVTVTTAGTPVRATANAADPTARIGAQAILVQGLPANTGLIYVGLVGMNKSTGVGVLGIIGAVTSPAGPGSWGGAMPNAFTGFNVADLYLDATVSGDKALVTYTQG